MSETQRIQDLVDAVERADQHLPFNASATQVIHGLRPGQVELRTDGDALIGCLVADPREETLQVAVHPHHRCQGVGTSLLGAGLDAHPTWTVWAFGNLDGAQGLARALGLTPVRELLHMRRSLGDVPAPELPGGYQLDRFTTADTADLVELNRLAFAHHPEQGKLTAADVELQTREPWFNPDGLLLARDETGDLAGFHWIKRLPGEELAEVYVIAVHPGHGGRGLGRALLQAGMHWMQEQGCTQVHLYVEASEARVVRMYESARFEVFNRDVSYALQEAP